MAFAAAIVGWAVVFTLPDRYEAETQVQVDSRTALKPALQGLTNDQDVGVQLSYVQQSLLVDAQLCRIANAAGMLPGCAADPGAAQIPLAQIRKRIQMSVQNIDDRSGQPGSAGATFDITYQDEDRSHALKVVSVLLDTLITQTLGGKRQGSENAQVFLESQLKDYEKRLQASEDKLATFKSQHLGVLPNEDGGYFVQMQKESQAVADAKTSLLMAQNRRATLEGQLHGNAAVLASSAMQSTGGNGAAPMDTVSEMAAAQAHLDELLLKFTDRHPDVIAARAAIAALKVRRATEIDSLRNGDAAAAAATGASSNPVFQSIQLALNKTDVEIADLTTQLAQHESKARDLRQLVDTAPQVEADFAQLSRDYDVNKAQYAALLSSYDKSKLGQRADDAGSVRFQIVQAPTVSFKPVSPKRPALLAEVFVAALVAGAALAYALDQLNPVIGSAVAVAQLTGLRVLAEVGTAFPDECQVDLATRAASGGDCHFLPAGCVSHRSFHDPRRTQTRHSGSTAYGADMGVIENALERMRSGGAGSAASGGREPATVLEAWPSGAGAEEVIPTRRITLDRAQMRAAGYLPEAGREMQFADYYREVKRPLIQRALAPGASASQRLILATSALPEEGKTFTVLNLALSMARERDVSVLLIDADFPKARLGSVLGVQEEPGLLDAVASPSVDVESLIFRTDVKGLDVLSGGSFSGGAAELVASARMAAIVAALVARNPRRLVLFDSSPLLVSSEARALIQLPGQIILVARSGTTPRRALQQAISQIDSKKLQGLVLNNAYAKTHNYYYGYSNPADRGAGKDEG